MKLRFGVVGVVLALLVAACGGGKSSNNSSLGGTNTTVASNTAACANHPALTAADNGVTPDKITVTVIADVDNGFRPGLFKGSWDGVKAWADYMNANGGLACRQVQVITRDSKLSGDEAKIQETAACGDSLALVGTSALFLKDASAAENCKDKAGAATGLPDFAYLTTDPAQECSKVTWTSFPLGNQCPYSGTGPRAMQISHEPYDYYFQQYGANGLHGVWAIPKDTPSTIASTMRLARGENKLGIPSDAEFGVSGLGTQNAYTPLVQAIKQHNSTYARNGLDYKGTVLLRKEAQAQGVTSVKVWDCSLQCYDKRLIEEGGSAVEGQWVWLNTLPMEDGASANNKELSAFLQYDKSPDAFGMQTWIAGELLARTINDTIKAHNNDPNSITRANLLATVSGIHDFDANGMAPKIDVASRSGSDSCVVGMQVKNGKFVRVEPAQPGTFLCSQEPPLQFTIDPLKEYHG